VALGDAPHDLAGDHGLGSTGRAAEVMGQRQHQQPAGARRERSRDRVELALVGLRVEARVAYVVDARIRGRRHDAKPAPSATATRDSARALRAAVKALDEAAADVRRHDVTAQLLELTD